MVAFCSDCGLGLKPLVYLYFEGLLFRRMERTIQKEQPKGRSFRTTTIGYLY